MSSQAMNKVELEFKRIQTYLFASPRLRAMLGANAALGHTIRNFEEVRRRDVANGQLADAGKDVGFQKALDLAQVVGRPARFFLGNPFSRHRREGVGVLRGQFHLQGLPMLRRMDALLDQRPAFLAPGPRFDERQHPSGPPHFGLCAGFAAWRLRILAESKTFSLSAMR